MPEGCVAKDSQYKFGPFPGRARLRAAVKIVSDWEFSWRYAKRGGKDCLLKKAFSLCLILLGKIETSP